MLPPILKEKKIKRSNKIVYRLKKKIECGWREIIRSPPVLEGEGGWKIFKKNSRGNKESWR
jgi:hypothetical protein